MKLPFMLKFSWGEETHFIEKLWAMSCYYNFIITNKVVKSYIELANMYSINMHSNIDDYTPKLHTIRKRSDRFQVGMKVQPFVWTYKPYKPNPDLLIPAQFDFMPPLNIVSKQRFDLDKFHGCLWPFVNETEIELNEVSNLAVNDGFNNDEHFFRHFNKPLENMEIRHFTKLKY